jgi:hypothetical protein
MNAPNTTDELLERLLSHPRQSDAQAPRGMAKDEPDEDDVLDSDAPTD